MQHTAGSRRAPLRSFLLPLAIALALLPLASQPASAGNTYYIATNGSDSNPGTSAQPWGTFDKAWTVLAPGDTLVVRDGRYYQSIDPAISGTSGSPIVIRAENDGGVILDGGGVRSGIAIYSNPPATVSYITIEGFRVENCGERPAVEVRSQDGTALSSQTHHIVIRRTGARGDAVSSNNPVWSIARTRDSLLEDVWGWGDGRYTINLYGCTRVTVRRGVFRWDGWGAGASQPQNPKFNMGVYDTHDSLIENVLLLDAAVDPYGGDKGGLYVPGNSNGTTAPYGDSDDNTFKGVISLNNVGVGLGVEGGSGGTNDNNRFENVISWGNSYYGVTVPHKASGTKFDHVTVAFNTNGFYIGGSSSSVSGTTICNSIIDSNPPRGINGPATTCYNIVFGNGTDYLNGASPGPNSISQDPLLNCRVRIEDGSPGKGTASDGGDRGATVLKRYVDGQLTADDLWPWPYQDRIRADLCESETRGLCDSSWSSLTEYVWGCTDDTAPSDPTNPALTNPTASTLDFSWTASTDDVGVAGYRIDVSLNSDFSGYVTGYNSKDVGNTTRTSVTGLQPMTSYYARVRAYDAAGNVSGNSPTASGTTGDVDPCLTATYPGAKWQNRSFTSQSGAFTAEADVILSAPNVDAAVSVSSGPQTAWDGLAATVLFYTDGFIKAINGGGYTAGTIHYAANTAYRVRLVVNLASHTYSAYVTPAGGSEQTIGTNLAFRTTQSGVTSLNNWTLSADAGSITACGFQVSPTPPPPPSTILQQGLNGYAGVTDTWINFYDPNLNFNGETKLNVQGTEDIKALVRFDLSALPVGTRITSATLSLYNYAHASSANGGTVSVYPVSRSWIDSQATWNQASAGNNWAAAGMQSGTDYRTSPVTSITIDTTSGVWRDFDATAIVQGWIDGTFPNNGFVVRSPTRGAKPLFYSSGYTGNPGLRPRLTIVY